MSGITQTIEEEEASGGTVTCPNCGITIVVPNVARRKGEGKRTGAEKTRLSENDMYALQVLDEKLGCISLDTAKPMKEISAYIREEAKRNNWRIPSEHTVGFWYSDLLGAQFVRMENRKCKIIDQETRQFRFISKPVWFVSEAYQNGELQVMSDGAIVKPQPVE